MYDYFEYFGLPKTFRVDGEKLEAAYRRLAKKLHPDRFADKSAFERRQAMLSMSGVNDAYAALSKPIARADYMLKENGVDALRETNTSFDPGFLQLQMDWRMRLEELRDAADADGLAALRQDVADQMGAVVAGLEAGFDAGDLKKCEGLVGQGRFVEKMLAAVDAALESLPGLDSGSPADGL